MVMIALNWIFSLCDCLSYLHPWLEEVRHHWTWGCWLMPLSSAHSWWRVFWDFRGNPMVGLQDSNTGSIPNVHSLSFEILSFTVWCGNLGISNLVRVGHQFFQSSNNTFEPSQGPCWNINLVSQANNLFLILCYILVPLIKHIPSRMHGKLSYWSMLSIGTTIPFLS